MKQFTMYAFAALLSFCTACNDNDNDDRNNNDNIIADSPATGNTETNMPRADPSTVSSTPLSNNDSMFMKEAYKGSTMEVDMGKLAQSKAMSERVKNFAAMLVQDHSKALSDLQAISGSSDYMTEKDSKDLHKNMDNLNKKTGNDFDKSYMKMMLDDHKKDVKKFEEASQDCENAALKNFAAQTLPVLRKHLDSAMAITGKK